MRSGEIVKKRKPTKQRESIQMKKEGWRMRVEVCTGSCTEDNTSVVLLSFAPRKGNVGRKKGEKLNFVQRILCPFRTSLDPELPVV